MAALRAAPSLSKFQVPQRSREPAASTAAASTSGYWSDRPHLRQVELAQANASRALFRFAVAGERNHDGSRAAHHDVHHRVVSPCDTR
jgi:hypothetical protein